jgi:hypothetical protein
MILAFRYTIGYDRPVEKTTVSRRFPGGAVSGRFPGGAVSRHSPGGAVSRHSPGGAVSRPCLSNGGRSPRHRLRSIPRQAIACGETFGGANGRPAGRRLDEGLGISQAGVSRQSSGGAVAQPGRGYGA